MGEFWNGDCLELMADIPSGSVDMVLCDLPYGTTQNKWDSVLPLDRLWAEYWRVCKPNAAVVLTAQCPFDKALGVSMLRHLKYEWYWIKSMSTGFLNAKKMPMKNVENVLVFYRGQPTYNPQMRTGFAPYKSRQGVRSKNYGTMDENHMSESEGDRYPVATLEFTNERGLHPTQKPVALFEYLIRTYTNDGDLVLDNTAGSGTTAIAAENASCRWLCIERDPDYYAMAVARVWDHVSA
jgi:site-specific DNA-methyltransferase (adenine-specific)